MIFGFLLPLYRNELRIVDGATTEISLAGH